MDGLAEAILDRVIFGPINLTTDSPICGLLPLDYGGGVAPYSRIVYPLNSIVSIVLVIVVNSCVRQGIIKTVRRDIVSICDALEDIGSIGDGHHVCSIQHYSLRIGFNAILIFEYIPGCDILKMLEAEMWRVTLWHIKTWETRRALI